MAPSLPGVMIILAAPRWYSCMTRWGVRCFGATSLSGWQMLPGAICWSMTASAMDSQAPCALMNGL